MRFRSLALWALVLASSVASAQLYSQLPQPGAEGGAFSDANQIVADGFTTASTEAVTHVTFWGSFFISGNPFPSGGSRTFSVSFFDDNAGVPGTALASANQTASFVDSGLLTSTTDTVYQFDFDWTGPSFTPTAGTFYWLSIYDTESTNSFRWHNGATGDTFFAFDSGGGWQASGDLARANEAFVLNPAPVPEPASMAALGVGALALLRRKRKD